MTASIITALKPSGRPHLGNFVGAIAPTVALAAREDVDVTVFVADGHALNSIRAPDELRAHSRDIVATYLACDVDPERVLLFRQSDVPETFELAAILACVSPKGLANRAHAYKASVARNIQEGAEEDADINVGLFTYPVLMAADILGVGATDVPVGPDQLQHVEITRELARRFDHAYGDVLPEPQARLAMSESLPGLDGRKMSKSYGNTIPLFAHEAELRRRVATIRTSSRSLGEPANPADHLVFAILRAIGSPSDIDHARQRLLEGAGDGEIDGAYSRSWRTASDRLAPATKRWFATRRRSIGFSSAAPHEHGSDAAPCCRW